MPRKSLTQLTKQIVDRLEPGKFAWDSVERGFGVRAYASGAKSFVFQFRMPNGGEQGRFRIGDYPELTVEDARRKAGKLRDGVKPLGDVKATNPSKARRDLRDAPTVTVLADYYLGEYAASKGLRAATVRDARDVLKPALSTIGRMKVADVTAADVRRARAKVRSDAVEAAQADAAKRRKALGAVEAAVEDAERSIVEAMNTHGKLTGRWAHRRSLVRKREEAARLAERAGELVRSGRAGVHQANRLRAVLSAMFTLAKRDWGVRSDNPCEGVHREHEEQRGRNLSEAEVGRVLGACAVYEAGEGMSANARGAADAVRLLLFTGARLREVLRAEWREFDLERGLWVKPSAHTKTKRLHRVELDGPALELLREMHTRRPHARFLFPGEPRKGRGGGVTPEVKPRVDLKRPWVWMVREAGLEDVRLHDLRRTLASFMLTDGASLATVGKALGHTQVATTARYAHLGASVQGAALGAAGRRMTALLNVTGQGRVVELRPSAL